MKKKVFRQRYNTEEVKVKVTEDKEESKENKKKEKKKNDKSNK